MIHRPALMAIVNITPDSFSGDGLLGSPHAWQSRIDELVASGADIIDIGGQSSKPDSTNVSCEEELRRVAPVIEYIANRHQYARTRFSIDTYQAAVAHYALSRGFSMINDITALRGDMRIIDVLMRYRPYTVLMYSKDPTARTTRRSVHYADVIETVTQFLRERIDALLRCGFPRKKIIVDPGMGAFVSSDRSYSYEIIERLEELAVLGCPTLVSPSRKLGDDRVSARLARTALKNGARIIRTHSITSSQRYANPAPF